MNVLVVEPLKAPYEKEIDPGLESLQHEVDGYIEALSLDDDSFIICNEEGKINGLELNRAIRDERGRIADIIAGTFLVVGSGEEDFISLTPEQIKKYQTNGYFGLSIQITNYSHKIHCLYILF